MGKGGFMVRGDSNQGVGVFESKRFQESFEGRGDIEKRNWGNSS